MKLVASNQSEEIKVECGKLMARKPSGNMGPFDVSSWIFNMFSIFKYH